MISEPPTQLSVHEVERFLAEHETLYQSVISKLRFAKRACEEGISRVHLIPGFHDEALLAELFSNQGIGVMTYADTYQTIREATSGDVDVIVSMTRRAIEDQAAGGAGEGRGPRAARGFLGPGGGWKRHWVCGAACLR